MKKNNEYYDQVQGQMGLTGAKWCDFLVRTKEGVSIQRIDSDEEHWKRLRGKLLTVYFKHFFAIAALFKD